MKYKFAVLVMFAVLFAACGGNNQKNKKSVISQPDQSAQVTEKAATQKEHPGKKVYDSVCLVCHMADGSGVPGMHPPIYESDFVNSDPEQLIKIILEGMSGKVEVKGEIYNSIMPPQAHLSNQQIADVLSYVRSSFGNNSGPILPEDVQKLRK
ncbi:c-type cytochrome [Maribellus maritimus]|uniref:c-type cytochrome n=1 Tax=Maribellus maritimus TaxID=2870838 RepID=UPI001EEBA770|nr:c-type cytochrome [Maribellus maritimus]MCG6187761.1 cytochrome c [Maribellus maritimus]